MAKLSNAAKQRHLETGGQQCCPYCRRDADHIEYGDLTPVEDGHIEQDARCMRCGRRWRDIFTLTDVRSLSD
ncbi:MAG: hypothetical protein KY475_06540 [Planctomycetes bacterium]|nr:hypothetical protein [Planctomycetota bacterium]